MSTNNSRYGIHAAVTILLLSIAAPAQASFHFWAFNEVFTNDDGTVQFIELFTASNGQQFATGEIFRAAQGGNTKDYTFPSNTPSPTGGHHLLLATSAFAALPGAPTPDFIMPNGFLYTPDGSLTGLGLVTPPVVYANIPTDGILSLDADGITTALNSPTNYAGDTASIDASPVVPAASTWGMIALVLGVCIGGAIMLPQRPLSAI